MTKAGNDPLLLDDPVEKLNGIGPKRAAALNSCGFLSIKDLLDNFPRRYLDKSVVTPISDILDGEYYTLELEVSDVLSNRNKLEVSASDNSASITLIWFAGIRFIQNRFKIGDKIQVSGKVGIFHSGFQIAHPDVRFLSQGEMPELGVFPVYTIHEEFKKHRLDNKTLSTAVSSALKGLRKNLPDSLPEEIIKKFKFPSVRESYCKIHFPDSYDFLEIEKYKNRFKFNEAWNLAKRNELLRREKKRPGNAFLINKSIKDAILKKTGFCLTKAQNRALIEIEEDVQANDSMNRLLHGDVGSGKTIIALLVAASLAIEKVQTALMAPSSILAAQHFKLFTELLEGMGICVSLLTGGTSPIEKEEIIQDLNNGKIDIIIGTHSLFNESVKFKNIGLVIIDEQHKFGVVQRDKLSEKGDHPNILNISATPIPRTLAISIFGDMDISIIDELPPGRIPVISKRVADDKTEQMLDFVSKKIKNDGRAFVVLPLLEESEKLEEVKSVKGYSDFLTNHKCLKDIKIAVVHGKMDFDTKKEILLDFQSGKSPLLVATTVVEVGIDVPNADVLIIENPERFGLAQLHQLRGRVGRGNKESYCFLHIPHSISPEAYERLGKFCETNNGFELAEFDLKNRGMGDYLGSRQSGKDGFKYLDFLIDLEIILKSKNEYLNYSKTT